MTGQNIDEVCSIFREKSYDVLSEYANVTFTLAYKIIGTLEEILKLYLMCDNGIRP